MLKEISYLRVSITDKCNMRCSYCRPSNVDFISLKDYISYDEIGAAIDVFKDFGLKKVRITGGEPLLRKDICDLVKKIKSIDKGISVSLTTNGAFLKDFAKDLKEAGVKTLNVSIDSLDENKFFEITKWPLKYVIEGLLEAKNQGFKHIKINTVLIKDFNDKEIESFIKFAKELDLHIRFIELMPVGYLDFFSTNKVVNLLDVKSFIEKKYGELIQIDVDGSKSSKDFLIKDLNVKVGFITPLSMPFCDNCSKFRLTPEGILKFCLRTDEGIDIKSILRKEGKEGLKNIMEDILTKKHISNIKIQSSNYSFLDCKRSMISIGG